MKNMIPFYQQYKNKIWTILGMLAVSMIVLPYLILGKGSYVQVHDQMDGEILNYIYRAKYLFRGNVIPEFMNGMSKASMIPPAPFGVFLYAVLPPFAAYVVMQWLVVLVGFWGMRGLCKYMGVREELASLTAILFAFIPFYPTYGLSALGQPLLVWCYLRLLKGEKKVLSILGILLYTGFSSLTLVGFVWILLGGAVTFCLLIQRKKEMAGRSLAALTGLTGLYAATNLELVRSLSGEGFTTHRQEMVLHPTEDLLHKFGELLFQGAAYHPVYSVAVMAALAGSLFYLLLHRKKRVSAKSEVQQKMTGHMAVLAVFIIVCIVLALLWNSTWIVELRIAVGGIVTYFQADRISWLLPMLWMLLLACVGEFFCCVAAEHAKRMDISGIGTVGIWRYVLPAIVGIVFLLEGAQIFRDSTLNKNMRLLLQPGYEQITWESLYMEKVFAQIDEAVGEEKERVSVVSLGIYPSVALYNGYICADGYSNNYSLDYKHAFRRIMAEELEKNQENRKYFDDWGNRLYLVSAEYGFNCLIGKGQSAGFAEPAYDVQAMKALNIGYILAAAPIGNAGELGLVQVGEEPFSDETSYYEVWVYRLPE